MEVDDAAVAKKRAQSVIRTLSKETGVASKDVTKIAKRLGIYEAVTKSQSVIVNLNDVRLVIGDVAV